MQLLARGAFQRRNFALARAAAEAYLRTLGIGLDEQAVAQAAAATEVPGRLQLVGEDPPTVLDGAHNPDAVAALVESLPDVLPLAGTPSGAHPGGHTQAGAGRQAGGEQPIALVLGVLEDKDAAGMLAALMPVVERAWFTAPPSSRALSPAALQSLARQLGFEASASEPKPRGRSSTRGAGPASAAAPCWRPGRCISSATCSAGSGARIAVPSARAGRRSSSG